MVLPEMIDSTYPIHMTSTANASIEETRRVRLVFCLVLTLINTIFLFCAQDKFLQDPDNWWHVRVGLDMLSSLTFPTVDTYSYTFAGSPWIAKEWLGQILLALAYSSAGWNGVVALTIATVALALFLLTWYLSNSLKLIIAIGLSALLNFLVSPVYNARPLIFTLPLIILLTAELFEASNKEKAPPFWLLIVIVLWANLHATFTFGFIIIAFSGLDFLFRVRLSKPNILAKWVAFGILCFLVSLINPYGIKAILATFTVAYGNEAVAYITEWQPFDASKSLVLEGFILLILFGALLFRPQIRWVKLLFLLFNFHLFLTHARFSFMFLILVPLALAMEIGEQFPYISARKWANEPRDRMEQLAAKYFYPISIVIGISFATVFGLFPLFSQIEPSPHTSAKGALSFVKDNNIQGNVLNSYNFGGTLIFHGIKTYIDGRTDQLFLQGFMKKTNSMGTSAGKPELVEQLKTHNIKWAILTANDRIIPFFKELPEWKSAYLDEYAVIFVKKD